MKALVRDRNFALLWIGQALSDVGSQTTTIALPLLVLALTGSPAKAGLTGLARTVAYPLFALPAGVVADRADRRRLIMAASAGRLVTVGSVPIALILGTPSLAQLLAVAFVEAGLSVLAMTAERGLLGEIVPAPQFSDAVAANEGRIAAAVTAGPPLGGALFGLSRALPFVADALSYLAVLGSLAAMRRRPDPPARARDEHGGGLSRAVSEAREGLTHLWSVPFLRASAFLYALVNVSVGGLELLGLLVARRHGASAAAIGGAFACVGVGGVIGALLAGPLRRRVSTRAGVLAEVWFDAVLMPGLLVAHSPLAIGLLLGVMVMPMSLSTSIVVGARLTLTPDRLRGRVQASSGFLASSLSWLGPLAVGVLFQYGGEDTTVIVVAGWALLLAVAASCAPALRSVPRAVRLS